MKCPKCSSPDVDLKAQSGEKTAECICKKCGHQWTGQVDWAESEEAEGAEG